MEDQCDQGWRDQWDQGWSHSGWSGWSQPGWGDGWSEPGWDDGWSDAPSEYAPSDWSDTDWQGSDWVTSSWADARPQSHVRETPAGPPAPAPRPYNLRALAKGPPPPTPLPLPATPWPDTMTTVTTLPQIPQDIALHMQAGKVIETQREHTATLETLAQTLREHTATLETHATCIAYVRGKARAQQALIHTLESSESSLAESVVDLRFQLGKAHNRPESRVDSGTSAASSSNVEDQIKHNTTILNLYFAIYL